MQSKNSARNIIKCVTLGSLLILNMYMIQQYRTLPSRLIIYKHTGDDIRCHTHERGNALPLADDLDLSVSNIMFFHETSCQGGLNSREACAVESAALNNPNWRIIILFSGPVNEISLKSASFQTLQTYTNVEFYRINGANYAKGTPIEGMFKGNMEIFNKSKHPLEHISDALRLLTLYKFGGVYLDLDVIVVRPFDSLALNFLGIQDSTSVGSGVIGASKYGVGHIFTAASIKEIETNFDPYSWAHNGPLLMERVLNNLCETKDFNRMTTERCQGFTVYPRITFYPIHYSDHDHYFKPGKLIITNETYVYHFWNKLTSNMKVTKKSLLAKLAEKFCPRIYNLYGDNFGL